MKIPFCSGFEAFFFPADSEGVGHGLSVEYDGGALLSCFLRAALRYLRITSAIMATTRTMGMAINPRPNRSLTPCDVSGPEAEGSEPELDGLGFIPAVPLTVDGGDDMSEN